VFTPRIVLRGGTAGKQNPQNPQNGILQKTSGGMARADPYPSWRAINPASG
jgi:hypothetical protein